MGEALEFAFGGSASSSGDSRSKAKSDAAVAAEKEAALFKSRHINAASHAAAIEDMHRRFADQQAERTASASASCSSAAGAVEERHVTDIGINDASRDGGWREPIASLEGEFEEPPHGEGERPQSKSCCIDAL